MSRKSLPPSRNPPPEPQLNAGENDGEILILLVGKTGNGKSSTGNALLATKQFQVSTGILSSSNETRLAESTRPHRDGTLKLKVVDFPDVTCDMTEEQAKKEVENCRSLTYPYPSATCLVIRADVRFTSAEYAAYQETRKMLGEHAFENMVVVFTMEDNLSPEQRDSFDEQLKATNWELKQVLQDAKNRYSVLSNRQHGNEMQRRMTLLMDTVLKLHRTNMTNLLLLQQTASQKEQNARRQTSSPPSHCSNPSSHQRGASHTGSTVPKRDKSNRCCEVS